MISSSTFRKVKSLVTLVAFCYSLVSPMFNIAFAVAPTVNLSYSANPTGAGTMTVTATYSESIVGTPLISIDQPGATDIVEATMLDLGTGSSWSYDYSVNVADGSGYIDGTANVTLTGAYNGSGEIADPASNATFDIVTVDIIAPVLTLSGSTPVTVLSGSVFSDDGATWTDNVDGSGVIANYNSGTLDVNQSGSYLIGYIYVDAAGNTGSVDRVVNVVEADVTAPIVTITGFTPMDVEFGGPFVDPGADWTDNVDGTGTIAGYNSGTLDVNTLWTYLIGYVLVDAAGNTGSVDRVVNVVDTTAPVLTLSGSSPVTIFSWGVFTDEGATWSDAVDGTGVVALYNSGTIDVNNTGSYQISYVYVDAAGNTGSVDRIVNVVDVPDGTPPVVTVSGELILDIEYGETFSDSWATWTDNLDGTGEITAYNSWVLDLNTLGTYILSYFYVDTDGNTGSADRTVNVVDTTPPMVTLSGANPIIIFTGWVFNDEWATWTDTRDGTGYIPNYNSGSLDVNNSGTYTLSYLYIDTAGNTGSVDRIVNVVEPDSIAPTVSLYDALVINSEIWWGYTDPGANWNDNIDGFGDALIGLYSDTGSFALSGTVDVNTVWMYFLEYLKVDTSWNSGNVMRVVNVVDTIMPETTVEKKVWQPDPSYTGTALYSVVFSEAIDLATFTTWSISFSWSSATGLIVDSISQVAPFDGRHFEIGVSAMSTWTIALSIRWSSELYGTTGDMPEGLTIDGSWNIYTVNYNAETVTKITPLGVSSTLGTTGFQPLEITVDEWGNVYVVNSADNTVTKITPLGVSSVFGTSWLNPADLVLDGSGNVYTADYWGNTVTKITPLGVSSVFGTTGNNPNGIAMDGSGNLYTSNGWDNTITKITPLGVSSIHATLDASPNGIVVDGSWNTYSILHNKVIVKVTPLGVSSIHWTTGESPLGISIDNSWNIYNVNEYYHTVTKTTPLGESTIIGIGWWLPTGVITDGSWNVYVSSYFDNTVTKITPNGIEDLNGNLHGNPSTSSDNSVMIIEPDTTAPVVTISGEITLDIEYAGSFVDDGATWTDNVDGTGVIANYNSGSLDVNTLGTYTIGYFYVDLGGNTGSVDRVVNIVDTTAPVLTLSGISPVNIYSGWVFTDEGATWGDAVDGSGIVANYNSGTLDVNSTGSYLISYVYVDGAGNTGSVDRVVNVVEPDTTAPVVTISGEITLDIEYAGPFVDDGATWTDNVDGSGTVSNYNSGSLDVNTLGSYLVSYFYVDTAGNTGSADRVVNVVDTTAPIVSLSWSTPVNIFSGGVFIDEGATWSDAVDGSWVIGSYNSGMIDVNNTGSYLIGYLYVDGAGNTGSIDCVVNVMDPDTTPPVVTLSGVSPVDTEYGSPYTDAGASWTDNFDGSWNTPVGSYGNTGSFAVSGTVDTSTLGSYLVEFMKVDTSGNSGTAVRTVNVVDTTAPVVTLSGATPVTIFSGSVYSDDGATWSDAVDGTGFIASATSWSVDTNTHGSYTLEYSYTDISGNTGTTTRIVNVTAASDIVPPVVTLVGSTLVNVEFGSSFVDLWATWTDNVDGTGSISAYNSGSVNTGSLGTYIISYLYVDGAGNTWSTNRTVNVVDTTAPTASVAYSTLLTTSGSVVATLTWSSEAITIVNNLWSPNYTFLANGSFSYTYIDASWNTGTTIATVNNIDTTAPVISIIGWTPITAALWSPYIDPGATANDNVSGNLTAFIVSSWSVNTSLTGTYIIQYSVSDVAGNRTTVSRTVNVSPVVSAPPVYNIGGGGGWSAGSVISYFSAPIQGFELNNNSSQTNSNSQNMLLWIANLQRLLNMSLPEEQWSESTDTNTTWRNESTPPTVEPITQDIDWRLGESEIIYLIQRWIINNSDNFDPDRTMTRWEFIKIVSGFYESPSEFTEELPFSDIESEEMRKYIQIAYSYGLITGQKQFRPNDPITTWEAKTILMRTEWTSGEWNLFAWEKNTITRENGAIIIVAWLADRM
jgi:large repetitive protein